MLWGRTALDMGGLCSSKSSQLLYILKPSLSIMSMPSDLSVTHSLFFLCSQSHVLPLACAFHEQRMSNKHSPAPFPFSSKSSLITHTSRRGCRFQSRLILLRSPHIQPTKISLPPNSNNARKNTTILPRDKRETKRRDRRPDLPAIDPTDGYSLPDALLDILPTTAAEHSLHAEEIAIEQRREDGLVDADLDRQTRDVGRVVEVVAEEHEPFVVRDRDYAADDERAQAADRFVGRVWVRDFLRAQVAQEVDCQRRGQLR